ncbi:tudor domain-containing 6-like [Acropora muricata]|uniref:tudor domain-containing 6-like n=1 Tax=Acropora muricata TaxID=159855 RepID=UPI0034E490E1
MPSLSNLERAGIAIGIPVAVLLLYLWYRRRRGLEFLEEEEEFDRVEENETIASANQRTVEVKVPRSVVGAIIGKSGANIKRIEKESGARVHLIDEDEGAKNVSGERIVFIQGEREMARRAEILIKKIIAEQPVIRTEAVDVPQRACGRIIGKGGQTIRHMCSVSGARIKIDCDGVDLTNPLRKCVITGTSDQIANAKGLLDEKVAEDIEMRNRRGDVGTNRGQHTPRKLMAKASSTTGVAQFPSTGEFFEVFVSAIDTPDHFWVQRITEDSSHLDELTKDLTSLYSSLDSTAVLNAFKVGDICCAPFELDSQWYRARILEMNEDGTVELYYVDFGDSGQISKDKLREIRQEHSKLPFQAIECFLSDVKPTGDQWSKEAIDEFENLSHCSQWVSLMAKVVKYSREIPCLELIDTAGQTDVNINEEMIKRQYAARSASPPTDEQERVSEPINVLSDRTRDELREPPEVINSSQLDDREFSSPVASQNGLESTLARSISDTLSEAISKDVEDAPASVDITDSGTALDGPVVPEKDSPVKAALVKTISKDYIPVSASSMPALLSEPDDKQLTEQLELVKELELQSAANDFDLTKTTEVEREKEGEVHLPSAKSNSDEKSMGYRSSLNITSSKRTMAASFTGSRNVTERNESSVKITTSTVSRVVPSKQSYVSSVTLPDYSKNGNVIVSVTPSVTQKTEHSPSEGDGHSFRASNESTTLTHETVTSDVHRTVTQASRSDTTPFTASRVEETLTSNSSSAENSQRVTYEINFQGRPGTDSYTVKKVNGPSLQMAPLHSSAAERSMSPSGSLLEVSSNTVIDEEEEYEQEVEGRGSDVGKLTGSESPEADSDTESFLSAKEDITSDTDIAAYMTAVGSSTSLYTDAMPPVDSATEEATTPVNTDTEVEEEENEDDETKEHECVTPRSHTKEASEGSDLAAVKGLKEQTILLGSDVTSDAELGYRGDTEEDLASTEDLRSKGMSFSMPK